MKLTLNRSLWLKILSIILISYLLICLAMYFIQKRLVFPAYLTQAVTTDWKPQGKSSEQALIQGQCGKLHVAMWNTPNAKGSIMMSHGNGESLASIDEYAYVFQDLGYNLMTWDYAGYGQSANCWFSQEMLLDDAETAYQWLAKRESANRIYLFGYSLGTGIALSVAAKHQENPVYLVAAYDSLLNVALDSMPCFIPVSILMRYPMQTKLWLKAIQQPIYLIHGTKDKLIRPERAQVLVRQAHGKAKIEWVKNATHVDDKLFAYRNAWLKHLLP